MMKRRLLALLLILGSSVTVLPNPAHACSVGYKKGWSPEEIKRRSDVRKVAGIFRLTEILGERFTGEDGKEGIRDAKLIGTIESKGGKVWKTIHPPPDAVLIETCGVDAWYHKPEADANGTFWIMRAPKDGRHRLMLWEGDYPPTAEEPEKKN